MLRFSMAILTALFCQCCLAGPAAVGMVLDLQGPGELAAQGGDRSPLKLLAYLQAGDRITLAEGSKASLSHYAAKQIYRLTGPVQVEVEAGALRHVSGAALQARSLAEKAVTAALHPNLGPAALKMRAMPQILVRAPANGGSVLGRRPQFRWEANEAATFELDLVELPDRPVAQAKVTASSWDLPPKLELAYGKSYRWTVSYTSAVDGKMRSAAATFNLPAKADAEMIAALAPPPDAAVDEWVLYATIMKEWNLVDAAAEAWSRIAARRPDLAHAH